MHFFAFKYIATDINGGELHKIGGISRSFNDNRMSTLFVSPRIVMRVLGSSSIREIKACFSTFICKNFIRNKKIIGM